MERSGEMRWGIPIPAGLEYAAGPSQARFSFFEETWGAEVLLDFLDHGLSSFEIHSFMNRERRRNSAVLDRSGPRSRVWKQGGLERCIRLRAKGG